LSLSCGLGLSHQLKAFCIDGKAPHKGPAKAKYSLCLEQEENLAIKQRPHKARRQAAFGDIYLT
jgi:hypothetical protein